MEYLHEKEVLHGDLKVMNFHPHPLSDKARALILEELFVGLQRTDQRRSPLRHLRFRAVRNEDGSVSIVGESCSSRHASMVGARGDAGRRVDA